MVITKFYQLISAELWTILQNNLTDERVKAHKNIELNKSYALVKEI